MNRIRISCIFWFASIMATAQPPSGKEILERVDANTPSGKEIPEKVDANTPSGKEIPEKVDANLPSGKEILEKVDANMASENRVVESRMIIHGRRADRTIGSKTWSVGDEKAFTEYLYPEREKGTKMLKLGDKLWIYSPSTDRTIQISGHMLRQSVMGSDLSYEDMMEDPTLTDNYQATVTGSESMEGRDCWVLELTAVKEEVTYHGRKLWIDKERFIPLQEELFAKSGKLLKRTSLSNVEKIGDRWFPMKIVFRDMLKNGEGTEFIVESIQFNVEIPEYLLTKASLTK